MVQWCMILDSVVVLGVVHAGSLMVVVCALTDGDGATNLTGVRHWQGHWLPLGAPPFAVHLGWLHISTAGESVLIRL